MTQYRPLTPARATGRGRGVPSVFATIITCVNFCPCCGAEDPLGQGMIDRCYECGGGVRTYRCTVCEADYTRPEDAEECCVARLDMLLTLHGCSTSAECLLAELLGIESCCQGQGETTSEAAA